MAFATHFRALVALLRQLVVPFPRYGRKCFLAGFETGLTAFAAALWALWWLYCINRKYLCQDTSEKVSSLGFKLVFEHLQLFLGTLVAILSWSDVSLRKYGRKGFFVGFEINFTAFTNLFWWLWWLFYVYLMYLCQDKGGNVSSRALKPVLQHSLHYFEHWWLFSANSTYFCQNTGGNVSSLAFKPVSRRLPHFFDHFGG